MSSYNGYRNWSRYTAAELGRTGWVLYAHSIDGSTNVVEEIEDIVVDYTLVDRGYQRRTAIYRYRIRGVQHPLQGRICIDRLEARWVPGEQETRKNEYVEATTR